MPPTVSVIIPVHDTVGYLEPCVMSAARQTIGAAHLEIIAIDDGSTDGSGEELDRLAERIPALTVIHQEASGGPGHPRNVGLDHATGDYVFFLDSDDRLGDEALERMVAMARRNDSDIVLGRLAGRDGRVVPRRMFDANRARAELFGTDIYYTLNPLKLFRRSHLAGLRFPEDIRVGEDQPFVAAAYLTARVISVIADYDCYLYARRGSSLTQRGVDYFERLPQSEQVMDLVDAHTEPGSGRDRLIARHMRYEVLKRFNKRFLGMKPPVQDRLIAAIDKVLARRLTDGVRVRLDIPWRLRAYCVRHGLRDELLEVVRFHESGEKPEKIIEGARSFLAYPFFRAGTIPDEVYETTLAGPVTYALDAVEVTGGALRLRGRAALGPGGGQSVELVLREATTGEERRFDGGPDFDVEIPLTPGYWDAYVAVTAEGVTVETSLGRHPVRTPPGVIRHGRRLTAVVPGGESGGPVSVQDLAWRHGDLTITGTAEPGDVTVRLTGPDDTVHVLPTERVPADRPHGLADRSCDPAVRDGAAFTCRVPLKTLTRGDWNVALHLLTDGSGRTVQIDHPTTGRARWRDGQLHTVTPLTTGRPTLTLRAATTHPAPIRHARRLARRLLRR